MTLQPLIFYASLFILSALVLKAIKHSRRLPPSPWALPIVGHLHLLGPSLHHSFHKLSTRYGPLMSIRIGSVLGVVTSSPDVTKELLKTNDVTFAARNSSAAIECLTYNSSFAFAPNGPYWQFMKKLTTVELLGSRTLLQFLPIRTNELHELIRFLFEKSKSGGSVSITDELLKFTNNIISQMMLSIRCSGKGGQAEECRTLAREVTEIFGEFNISDIIWIFKSFDIQGFRRRFKDIHRRFDSLLENIITNREKLRKEKKESEEKVKDLLDILLDVLENQNSEIKLTRDHIKALFLDFLTAGTDTSSMTVEWALAELINHPMVLQKAQQEIDQVVGRNRLVQESDFPRLPYIQAIIKESFRIHPPIPLLNRRALEDCKIGNYIIPKGTLLFVNLWSMGRDPKIWKNPLEFQPERFFSQSNSEIDVRGLHYQLLPFGTGRRGCPGLSLAMQELPTALASMIQCFDFKVTSPDGVVDMSERPGLSSPRAQDLVCVPVARCAPSIVNSDVR
ncbi:cytochrome p450 [Citrus sinensis]|uniref:Cytochrome p450 n=1 Tax=Citrus sinensis TaxID=2711 RepID=A0ACB8M7T8_CITSI|nr:cytochrome p450 [Citrus sinensis]